MGQTVSDIMTTDLVSLSAEHSVRDAARRMREANVGAIVVQKHGNLFGIVTDRDIVVRCLARGGDCDETPLSEICSPEVTTLGPDDEVDRAVTLMRDKAIRRIPVVKNGKAVGILSLGDLALQRDPFSALGAISKALPNNELAAYESAAYESAAHDSEARELAGYQLAGHQLPGHQLAGHDAAAHELTSHERASHERASHERLNGERPSVARATPTVRLAAVRR
jgi:CBS domain-containing protein